MKNITLYIKKNLSKNILFIVALILFSLVGCKETKKEPPTANAGMTLLDLSNYGYSLFIQVPDSTKGVLQVEDAKDGTVKIKVGKSFGVSFFEDNGDIALKKSDISGDEINKLKRYIIDEPNTIFYETEITSPEFHFYTVVNINQKNYVIEDLRDDVYTEQDVKTMLESVKSIVVKEKKSEE